MERDHKSGTYLLKQKDEAFHLNFMVRLWWLWTRSSATLTFSCCLCLIVGFAPNLLIPEFIENSAQQQLVQVSRPFL